MKNIIKGLIFGLIVLGFTSGAIAQPRGTKAEAESVVKAAIAYMKANGKEKALAEANKPDSTFRRADLYAFAYDKNGVNLAHSNQKMVGKNLIDMKDADGVEINKEFLKMGNSKEGHGWVNYRWPNPISKAVEAKESYVEKYEDVYWMCGYYK